MFVPDKVHQQIVASFIFKIEILLHNAFEAYEETFL